MKTRFLANYLLAIASLQFLFYLGAFVGGGDSFADWDPRFGWHVVESVLMHSRFPGVLNWVLATALLFAAGLIREERLSLRTYALLEMGVALPTAAILIVAGTGTLAGLSEAHGPTLGAYALAIPGFAATSVFPVLYAAKR